jgi:alcohol dehydrogenase class IV
MVSIPFLIVLFLTYCRLSTGIRALDHAVGTYYAFKKGMIFSESIAESLYRPLVSHPVKILCYAAMADLFKYLPISMANPTDIEARQKLLIAAWMSLWPTKFEEYRLVPFVCGTFCTITTA